MTGNDFLKLIHLNCLLSTYRYDACLHEAKNVGAKKGISTGIGIGLTSFFLFFMHAVGFWFGAYLIQYHDATLGDVLTVSNCIQMSLCIVVLAL